MKTYVIGIIIALSLIACSKNDDETLEQQHETTHVTQIATHQQTEAEYLQQITPYLKAVNRSWDRLIQSCYDSSSETLFVQFPDTKPATTGENEEYYLGWQIVKDPKWTKLGNGTQLFTSTDAILTSVAPDITGLPCVMQDMVANKK